MNGLLPIAVAILALWVLGLGSGVAALLVGRGRPSGRRFGAALGLSLLALVVAWLGMNRLNLTYSRSVNGNGWSVQSKWLFVAPAILGIAAAAIAVGRKWSETRSAAVPR